MSKESFGYACILSAGVFIGAVSQVILKKAAMRQYPSRLRAYLNPAVLFAYTLFVGTTFLSILAYRGIPLSLGPILESAGYLYVTAFGALFFGERVTVRKIAALALILSGIAVYALAP